MKGRALAAAGAPAFLLLTVGCPKPAEPPGGGSAARPSAARPQAAVRNRPVSGQEVFQQYCAACHGPSGGGLPNLGIPLKEATRLSDDEIRRVIEHGRREMPDFKDSLTEDQIAAVIRHVRGLATARRPVPAPASGRKR